MPVEPSYRAIESWAPISGVWARDGQGIEYRGPQPQQVQPFGLYVSNVQLSEGSVRVRARLGDTADSAARILFGYRSPTECYYSVGLGGYGLAYVLSEFNPSSGWRGVAYAGSAANLEIGTDYLLEATLLGQRLHFSVDGVRVLATVLDAPLSGGQIGLYAWGERPVHFSDASYARRSGKAFVVMQFTTPYQELYAEVIKPVAKDFDLEAYHAGEVYGPGIVLQDIVQGIVDAQVVIAEITPANQNVFYELGYAHALGKPTILLAERGKTLPFDITGYRCVFYDNTIAGKSGVEAALRNHLRAIFERDV